MLKCSFVTCKNLLNLDGLMADRNHSRTSSEDEMTLYCSKIAHTHGKY